MFFSWYFRGFSWFFVSFQGFEGNVMVCHGFWSIFKLVSWVFTVLIGFHGFQGELALMMIMIAMMSMLEHHCSAQCIVSIVFKVLARAMSVI